jgi:hypothetical protein
MTPDHKKFVIKNFSDIYIGKWVKYEDDLFKITGVVDCDVLFDNHQILVETNGKETKRWVKSRYISFPSVNDVVEEKYGF